MSIFKLALDLYSWFVLLPKKDTKKSAMAKRVGQITPTRQVTRATHVRNRICLRVKLIIKIIIILLIIFLGFIKSKSC